jgi:hypothetical protein
MANLTALENAVLDLLDVATGRKAHLNPAEHAEHVAAIHAPAEDVTDDAPASPEPGPDGDGQAAAPVDGE